MSVRTARTWQRGRLPSEKKGKRRQLLPHSLLGQALANQPGYGGSHPVVVKNAEGLLHHLHRRLVSGNIFVLRVAGYQHNS